MKTWNETVNDINPHNYDICRYNDNYHHHCWFNVQVLSAPSMYTYRRIICCSCNVFIYKTFCSGYGIPSCCVCHTNCSNFDNVEAIVLHSNYFSCSFTLKFCEVRLFNLLIKNNQNVINSYPECAKKFKFVMQCFAISTQRFPFLTQFFQRMVCVSFSNARLHGKTMRLKCFICTNHVLEFEFFGALKAVA